jgi:hypothetical protein
MKDERETVRKSGKDDKMKDQGKLILPLSAFILSDRSPDCRDSAVGGLRSPR